MWVLLQRFPSPLELEAGGSAVLESTNLSAWSDGSGRTVACASTATESAKLCEEGNMLLGGPAGPLAQSPYEGHYSCTAWSLSLTACVSTPPWPSVLP